VKVAVAVPMSITFDASSVGGGATPLGGGQTIPARYLDAEKSGLGFEVVRGARTRSFDLTP